MMQWLGAILVLAAFASAQTNPGLIVDLPGAPPNVTFNQYSGYVCVNQTHGRYLFYWFVESQNNPATDPLVLWLNGGPGCSSLGGFLSENGPFWVNTDGATLRVNPYAWNFAANVIYLESPAGVGFSYSETPSDYNTGDAQTASDSVAFLQQFLLMYPQFQNNPFWISGESYAGHYVPNLAKAVLQANAGGGYPLINLKGFQVGNAWTNAQLDNEGAVLMWYYHAMISEPTYNCFFNFCNFSNIGPLAEPSNGPGDIDSALCDECQIQADLDMADINIYQVYYDVCHKGETVNEPIKFMQSVSAANPNGAFAKKTRQLRPASDGGRLGDQEPDMDPCVDQHMTEYLNQPSVQAAIHANPTVWSDCNNPVNYSRTDLLTSMIPVYQWLLTNSTIRMLVYSGDVDGIVPTTGTRAWIASMNMTTVNKWRPWIDSDAQTGGWTESYSWGTNPNGLTFASVRDAGHMVPWCQPMRSFDLFTRFLAGKKI